MEIHDNVNTLVKLSFESFTKLHKDVKSKIYLFSGDDLMNIKCSKILY